MYGSTVWVSSKVVLLLDHCWYWLVCWYQNFASVQMIMFCHRVHKVSNQLPQLTFPKGAQPRMWHTVTALSLGPVRTQVTMFGGCPKWERGKTDDAQQKVAETTVLDFGEQNIYAVLTFFEFSGFNFPSSTIYHIAGNFCGRQLLWIGGKTFVLRNTRWCCQIMLCLPNFVEKTFANSHKTLKFAKVFPSKVSRYTVLVSFQWIDLCRLYIYLHMQYP